MIYFLLRGLAALFALLLALSLLFGLFGRRRRWRLWLGLGIVLVAFVVASETVTPAMPFQEAYHGRPRTGCDSLGAPASAVAIGRGRRIEAFERRPGDPAPTVRLLARGGRVKWCVYATAGKGQEVRSLRFDRVHTTLVGGTVAVGRVQWTHGDQATWWYLYPFGGLRAYFYWW